MKLLGRTRLVDRPYSRRGPGEYDRSLPSLPGEWGRRSGWLGRPFPRCCPERAEKTTGHFLRPKSAESIQVVSPFQELDLQGHKFKNTSYSDEVKVFTDL